MSGIIGHPASVWRRALFATVDDMRKEDPSKSEILLELLIRVHSKFENGCIDSRYGEVTESLDAAIKGKKLF